jgi:hypothetical protein
LNFEVYLILILNDALFVYSLTHLNQQKSPAQEEEKRRRGDEEEEEERKSICVVRQKRAGFLYIAIAHNNARRTRRQRVCTKKVSALFRFALPLSLCKNSWNAKVDALQMYSYEPQ